jgi:SAM-dependent methyltransferase
VSESVLVRRYADDGVASLALTVVQRDARNKVAAQILTGEYALATAVCPLCGASEREMLASKDMYGLPMGVALCMPCGLVYTSRRLADAALDAFYRGEYRRLDRGVALPQESFFELELAKGRRIVGFLNAAGACVDGDALVLEVGCGAGGVLAPFADRGHPVLGVDPGREYVEYGARAHGLDLVEGDVETAAAALRSRATTPGLIIYEQVLEHVPDPVAELRRVRGLLAEGNLLYVGVPGLRNVDAHYDSDFLRYLQISHLVHFELATLRAMVEPQGFVLLAGDETVRALFAATPLATNAVPRDRRRASRTLEFLCGLERRRRRKEFARQIRARTLAVLRLPLVVAVRMRGSLRR